MGLFIYYLFFVNFIIINILCHIFQLLRGEGGMGFIFLHFLIFSIVC